MSFFGLLSILVLCFSPGFVAAQRSTAARTRWQTLSGDAPVVVARGGFSGVFPDSSIYAYQVAVGTSLPGVVVWCDVQLTRDGAGVCLPDISLQNVTDVNFVYGVNNNSHVINGVTAQGWLSIDFTLLQLTNVTLIQRIYSRSQYFDALSLQILTVQDVVALSMPPGLWLNVQHDAFYSQHNLSMRNYVISTSRRVLINYISSPEIGFLRSIASRISRNTRLVFQIMGPEDVEPTTNQTYGSLLSNLTLVTTFASGILVPKNYIWPVDDNLYLQNHTYLVAEAHRAGLEVYASNFANDAILPYDYNSDPVAEYLSFIDNGVFSVDGVLSSFPITPSATIDCYSHMSRNGIIQANVSIISNEGASGEYPGCTDLAYHEAVSDGADILDCPVQISGDGIPFCLGSINLRDRTNVAQSAFISQAVDNPEIGIQGGVFTYNLTWSEIQTLRPALYSPYARNYRLYRNPRAENQGNFMQLSDFLALANNASSVSGVLISVENAAYLARAQGLDAISAVLNALNQSGYNNQTAKRILIQSSDSAVLSSFKSRSNYELVYLVDQDIRGVLNSTISEIRNIANAVVVSKGSVLLVDNQFLETQTEVVRMLQAFNLSVYVRLFQNEFVSQPWDFFSDAYVELNSYYSIMAISGFVTDYPATASRFRRNRCLGYRDRPVYMNPILPGSLMSLVRQGLPPAEAPNPILTASDVVEPPLPPVSPRPRTEVSSQPGSGTSQQRPRVFAVAAVITTAFVVGSVLL